MPAMNKQQLATLRADKGAFSIVTNREATKDRCVTLDRHEKEVLSYIFQLDSFTRKGGGMPDGRDSRVPFRVHARNSIGSIQIQLLSITHPKQQGNELRLYMLNQAEFYAQTGDVFFIYFNRNDDIPNVGFVDQDKWKILGKDAHGEDVIVIPNTLIDEEDDSFQRALEANAAGIPVLSTGLLYPRSPKVSMQAIVDAGHMCELDPEHKTFISTSSGKQYVEAHHLIPVSAQKLFEFTLDVNANIFALCPICHRNLHLGVSSGRVDLLRDMFDRREKKLIQRKLEIDLEGLLSFYNIT